MPCKYFSIERLQQAIEHLQSFRSDWTLVPLVLAVNGVNSREEVDVNQKHGTDKFLDKYFSGSLIELPPFENGVNTLRPRFKDTYQTMKTKDHQNEYVLHQKQKLWANAYSSRGYREMERSGLITNNNSRFKLLPPFESTWKDKLPKEFHFEELLVWLYVFNGFDSEIDSWDKLYNHFQLEYLENGNTFEAEYLSRFHVKNNVDWNQNSLVLYRPSSEEFQRRLIPSATQNSPHDLVPHIAINDFNKIVYGAPGVGKSYSIKQEIGDSKSFVTTFHPEYSYSDFLGSFRPATENSEDDKKTITYLFRPEVFLRAYVEAWINKNENIFLIIEEINRGNSAAIFGDIFQLLDRDEDGYSEYAVSCREEIRPFLKSSLQESVYPQDIANIYFEKFGRNLVDPYSVILLPSNFIIRATMNTSDQSLFPMDSAFKRRWSWEYVSIKYVLDNRIIEINDKKFLWKYFLSKINNLIYEIHETEDKCIGSFFVKGNVIKAEEFRSKVIFYLWNDIFRDELPETRLKLFPRKIVDDSESDFSVTFNDFFDDIHGWDYLEKMFANLGIEPISSSNSES